MHATIFIYCATSRSFMKILAWQVIRRNGILREIKRLELRITEMGRPSGKSSTQARNRLRFSRRRWDDDQRDIT